MKIFSWNVNGIRSVFKTTFKDWMKTNKPDIVCLQEIKADFKDLEDECTKIDGYYSYFNSAQKRGYSGVAVYSKIKPISIETKLGIKRFDDEGRYIKLEFPDFSLFNFYIPHGGRLKENLSYKLEVYDRIFKKIAPLSQQETLLVGDFNIAHTEEDLYYPKQNKNNIMFTPEERKRIDTLINLGYIDTFRSIHPDKKCFTWWPYMGDLRENNIGWRIDYIFTSQKLKDKIQDAFMQKDTLGSDHCPYGVILNKKIEIGEKPRYEKSKPSSLF